MPVATSVLMAGIFTPGAGAPGFACPDGHTIIVKHVSVTNTHSAAQDFEVWVFGPTSESPHKAWIVNVPAAACAERETWLVLVEGCSMYLVPALGTCTYWISGSILTGEAPSVPPAVVLDLPTQLPGTPIESGLTAAPRPGRKR